MSLLFCFWIAHIVVHLPAFTSVGVKLFSKIVQNKLSSRHRSFCKSYNFLQQGMTYLLLCDRFTTHEFFKLLYVFITVVCQTMTLATITTSTTRFLIITFYTFWDIVVNHKTNIWLVNTHTKGNSCNNNICIFH